MNQERQSYYNAKLKALSSELREDLDKNPHDAKTVELDTSIGRLSRMDAMQSQQMALELRRRQQNQILRIENALKRIENGTFGVCARCGKPISEERLEVQPDAVACIHCMEAR